MQTLQEQLDFARQVIGKDPVATQLGLEVSHVALAEADVRLLTHARHLKALGRVHGSMIYALADQALAVAGCTLDQPVLVMQVKINFIAAAEPGEMLTAKARPLELKKRIGLWSVSISTAEEKEVAMAQGLTYHKPPPGG